MNELTAFDWGVVVVVVLSVALWLRRWFIRSLQAKCSGRCGRCGEAGQCSSASGSKPGTSLHSPRG